MPRDARDDLIASFGGCPASTDDVSKQTILCFLYKADAEYGTGVATAVKGDLARVKYWLPNGSTNSPTVSSLLFLSAGRPVTQELTMGWYKAILMMLLLLLAATSLVSEAAQHLPSKSIAIELNNHLFNAARRGDTQMLALFIESGYAIDTQDSKGDSALMLAAYHGRLNVVERLLTADADPCARNRRGDTAFMVAILGGEAKIAERLLKTHCNVGERNAAIQTAAMYAALLECVQLLDALEDWEADTDTQAVVQRRPSGPAH